MDYTDYGSLLSKNSSNSTGAYTNEPQVNYYGSSLQSRPAANGAYSPYSRANAEREANRNVSYFSEDASARNGVYSGGGSQPRSNFNDQTESRRSAVSARENGNPPKTVRSESEQERMARIYGNSATQRSSAQGTASNRYYSGSVANNSGASGYGVNGAGTARSNFDGNNAPRVKNNNTNGNSAGANGAKPKYTNYTSYVYSPPSGGNGNGKGGGNGSGNGKGNGNGSKKPQKKLTFQQKALAWLKRFLRSIYLMEKPMRIFLASAAGFVLIGVILIFAVSGSRHKEEETMAAQLALMTTPAPTIAATATPVPTPSPTPEVRIEKGAEGEDVMALQKRLMELGYLAIDEPTSYFGNATKYAVKLFQRQHELQQDGICGNDTIALLYSEEAKKYVMTEGAEGDDIESFQEQLVELGYLDDSQVTGYYGTVTVEAVKKFQNRNYITKDGKAGEQTLEEINSADARVSYTKEKEIAAEKKKQAALARASSPAGRIDKMISIAKKQLGDTYILGKSGPDSFDCSGLVYYCLRQVNVYTRRLNAAGLSKTSSWTKISDIDNVKAGDLLFFKSDDSSTVGHVGIYIGGGEMIDASSANGKVVRRGAKTSYWRRNFVVARRPIE
ncbi:MAG: peptidoglycan-binding protein [Eubacteriales bacterium]|nr:peptidoglycan-binding protein [Eubacteriales bacterium]